MSFEIPFFEQKKSAKMTVCVLQLSMYQHIAGRVFSFLKKPVSRVIILEDCRESFSLQSMITFKNDFKDADVTVLMWRGKSVKANHAFKKGELNKESVAKIAKSTEKILD